MLWPARLTLTAILTPACCALLQEALERKLFLLETHQKEIHDALASIEGEAERICSSERSLLDSDTLERDRLYSRAEGISSALLSVGGDLQVRTDHTRQS